MMAIRSGARSVLHAAATAVFALLAMVPPAFADNMVGKITAIDYGARKLEIEGATYVLSPVATEYSSTEQPRSIKLQDFRYGQVVAFEAEDEVVLRMSVLPGATEVPK